MAVLKIKDANGDWQNIVALKGDQGERGPEGPVGPAGGVSSVNGMTGDVTIESYSLPTASYNTLGGVTIGSNISVSNGKISLSKANVTDALGYTPSGTITLSSLGITATTTELNYCDGVTSNIQTQLNGKLSTSGTAAKATADASGNNIASTYLTKTDASNTYLGKSATAAKATADASGNNIANTYFKKSEITSSTTDLTAGSSALTTGSIYLVYE